MFNSSFDVLHSPVPLAAITFLTLLGVGVCPAEAPPDSVRSEVIATYIRGAAERYAEVDARVVDLGTAIQDFIAAPDAEKMNASRDAWKAARRAYSPSEVYRFYDGPIDNATYGVETLMNGWPMDEAYIDYVEDDPGAGVINHPAEFPQITPLLLTELNEQGGEENIAAGFHAIEFLLWGQDKSATGPGERSHRDFVDGGAPNAARRREYLRIAAELLAVHAHQVAQAWRPGVPNNYAALMSREKPAAALQKIFTGIALLALDELGAERLAVPLETRDQEDEQSCFSDTTLDDHLANAMAIRDVYLGRYGGEDLAGPEDLVAAASPKLEGKIKAAIEQSIAAISAIPAPFDRALRSDEGCAKILEAVKALEHEAALLGGAATLLGFYLDLENDPDGD